MARTSERGGLQTRTRILDVSTRMFLERGYDAVTVAEIAREAGVSSVTVFKYFPRKEDLFLDRSVDAEEFLRGVIRSPWIDIVAALWDATFNLMDTRQPLSGLDDRSIPFFRTVAGSPALIARARDIMHELQALLADELQRDERFKGDPDLFAVLFIAGYALVLVRTAQRLIAGEDRDIVEPDHRRRLANLFAALDHGFTATS